jgi:hypothetical protein
MNRAIQRLIVVLGGMVLGSVVLATPASAAPPPISYQATVVATFTNSVGGTVLYRQGWHAGGSTGFGRDKVHNKHGITNDDIVAKVVNAPQQVLQDNQQTPGRWVHRKEALLVGLTGVTDRVWVRVVIEYHGWSGPGQHGVVTAYCEGYPGRCPEWVNRAF